MNKAQFIFISVLLSLALHAHALSLPRIFLESSAPVRSGDTFRVTVFADTKEIPINSLELAVGYDQTLVSFTGYSDANSIINLWLEPPFEKEPGKIVASGIIPGGVSGLYDPHRETLGPMPLLALEFTARGAGEAVFDILDSQILRHDGKGTPLLHEAVSTKINIGENPDATTEKDNATPETPAATVSISEIMWMTLLALLCGIAAYKLLKYRI